MARDHSELHIRPHVAMTASTAIGLQGRTPLSMARQRGAALLFSLLLVVVGVGLFVTNASREATRLVQAELRLGSGLKEMKEALIAYAVAHPTRPGALPCPDTVGNGVADAFVTGACPTYIGRLPWRTLGIGDVRDESAERYWYALSPNFRDAVPINSDTKGDRVVRSGSTAVTLTSEAVAIVFSPGGALGNQVRDASVAACAATGTAIAHNLCPDNYLETAATVNNASTTGPYIVADASGAFNDRLIVLRTPEFIPLVERRVAADVRRALLDYKDAATKAITGGGCNCFPWPDSDNDGISNTGNNRGRVPLSAAPHAWSPQPPNPPNTVADAGGTSYPLPALPAYFQPNNWRNVIYYAVGRNVLQNYGLAPTACTTCTADPLLPPPQILKGTLSLDASIGIGVLLIMPGSAGASRPSANWANYLDDAANSDNDDRFVTPVSKAFDRDRVYTVPDNLPPESCNSNAKVLVYHAPCHTTGNNVKPVCARAASNLQFCASCSGDATTMVTPPCRNTLNPNACQGAVAKLQGCKF